VVMMMMRRILLSLGVLSIKYLVCNGI